jgi:hypothetical protein
MQCYQVEEALLPREDALLPGGPFASHAHRLHWRRHTSEEASSRRLLGRSDEAIHLGHHRCAADAYRPGLMERCVLRQVRGTVPELERRFGAEEAVGWSVGRQMMEPGQRVPRSQSETRVPLRPDAIDRTVRPTDRAPPPLSTETPPAERALRSSRRYPMRKSAPSVHHCHHFLAQLQWRRAFLIRPPISSPFREIGSHP